MAFGFGKKEHKNWGTDIYDAANDPKPVSGKIYNKLINDYREGSDLFHMVKEHYYQTDEYLEPDRVDGNVIGYLKNKYGTQ